MYVKPVEGRQVPDPEKGGFVPPEGRHVDRTQYWLRRIADGDLLQANPPAVAEKPAPAEKE